MWLIATTPNFLSWCLTPASGSGEAQLAEVLSTEDHLLTDQQQRLVTAWHSATALSTHAMWAATIKNRCADETAVFWENVMITVYQSSLYTSLFTKLVVDRNICEKNKHRYIYNKKEKTRKKNSEQMFSYYILHIQLHTMITDTLPLLW